MGKVTKSHCDTGRGCCVRGALVVILGTHNLPQSSGFDSWYLQAISIYCPKTPNVSFHCGIRLINLIIEIRPCLGWGFSGLPPWIQLLHAVSLNQSTHYLHLTHLKYNSKTQLGTTGVLIQQLLGIEQPLIHIMPGTCYQFTAHMEFSMPLSSTLDLGSAESSFLIHKTWYIFAIEYLFQPPSCPKMIVSAKISYFVQPLSSSITVNMAVFIYFSFKFLKFS